MGSVSDVQLPISSSRLGVRGRKIYEGKWKILYETQDPALLIQRFKDTPMLGAGRPRAKLPRRGAMKNQISAAVFRLLQKNGIPTHFVEVVGERDMLVRRLEMIRLEVVLRNIAAGSLAKRLGMEVGTTLPAPVLEFYYKSDALGDPLLNEYHVRALGLASSEELRAIRETTFRANGVLLPFFAEREILLADFKLEFGRQKGALLVGDELTPDGCRFWDRTTRENLGKDRARRSLAREATAYQEIFRRVCT
ncbi:MAG: phosphoribosylaminoimidazolesuccinocarboxamide synthase [candidate division NC10 bacterium RIFCSPLOWO2_12_FULL_66_18]|nr:MAG: phosphoribosylaminoimidazolesuccinocarboxamide synthase [candidate division NC10 bacterium RIFCSPLOWO2_02_FULL_66_22]OGC02061.1 MAG: phosphoribosylaminoimidazolesuccinocarboxamide synthase [candidate division NC10 bacterium RIFCSPLOWO2_12_FULL_66_18]